MPTSAKARPKKAAAKATTGVTARAPRALTVKAYRGDAKTLLAFNLPDRGAAEGLAGFTIACQPPGQPAFYLQNNLRFEVPGRHAQVATEPATSSINAPIHKFRWLHVPGTFHGTKPTFGRYTYTVTPRFFDDSQSLLPLDPARSVSVAVDVGPFATKGLELGFTRGFTQSQAFVHHFGLKAPLRPDGDDLQFDTGAVAGTNSLGATFTFADEYEWSGYTARSKVFAILDEVVGDPALRLDVFAYDLNEPDVVAALLKLAGQGRVRVLLDDASLHHSASKPTPEDRFAGLFERARRGEAALLRGHFKRYAHDKVLIVSDSGGAARKVLTGSTNFSITGMYVNSNHVIVFNDPNVAAKYREVFEAAWSGGAKAPAFLRSPLATETFDATSRLTPKAEITFSPHPTDVAERILDGLVARIKEEQADRGSVLFAVMEIGTGTGPVYPALRDLHADQEIFSYGISDTTSGIELYATGHKTGVLVTGKPARSQLPPPFDQVPQVSGLGHQVHHKFVVCGFNGDAPVVYCGSSNLALGGEESNGDNLIAIHDGDVATAFAIEALALVDHFDFLDRCASAQGGDGVTRRGPRFASKQQLAASAGWFLSTDDRWAAPYFDPDDLRCVDRELFGA